MLLTLSLNYVYGQCTVTSSTGYVVHININPTSIQVSSMTCPFGYNFNYNLNYNVTFTGTGIPASLFTLQGNVLASGYSANFFDLPNNGGTGSTTSVGNSSTTNTNCATVQVSDLNPTIQITIQGPGIPFQNIICAISTPITLISFNGNKNSEGNLLEWSTASEINNDYFVIMKSIDGINWIDISKIKGSNNSNSIINYSFIDINNDEVNYYKLKQVDNDNQYSYSSIIKIGNSKNINDEKHIFNLLGQEINIKNNLSPGIYLVKEIKNNEFQSYKLIIE